MGMEPAILPPDLLPIISKVTHILIERSNDEWTVENGQIVKQVTNNGGDTLMSFSQD